MESSHKEGTLKSIALSAGIPSLTKTQRVEAEDSSDRPRTPDVKDPRIPCVRMALQIYGLGSVGCVARLARAQKTNPAGNSREGQGALRLNGLDSEVPVLR